MFTTSVVSEFVADDCIPVALTYEKLVHKREAVVILYYLLLLLLKPATQAQVGKQKIKLFINCLSNSTGTCTKEN